MLRRADEREKEAFRRVERTVRRTRPRAGTRGLESLAVAGGTIERGWLGRLRVRFEGNAADFDPENRPESRELSDEEESLWVNIQKIMETAAPRADPEWNLISMRIGPRVLSRLVSGTVVTFTPNGVAASASRPRVQTRPKLRSHSRTLVRSEALLLAAVDAFLRETDNILQPAVGANNGPGTPASRTRARYVGASLPMFRTHHFPRGKWHKCPICHAPVVKGRFNPRVPFAQFRAGRGSIRDLRGTFLSRLRETYLVLDPESVLGSPTSQEEDATPSRVREAAFSAEVSAANRTVERRASLGVPDFRSQDD